MNKTDVEDKKLKLTAKEEYEYIINARNFHYQEFNKWSRYFGLLVSALFVAYYTVRTNEICNCNCQLKVLIAFMGYVASMCWYWSNKGYTYWWIHWSKYLTYVESQLESNFMGCKGVYRTFFQYADRGNERLIDEGKYMCPFSGANISTSKIVLIMSFLISVSWGYVLLSLLWVTDSMWIMLILFPALSVSAVLLLSFFAILVHSDMRNHIIVGTTENIGQLTLCKKEYSNKSRRNTIK